jgi:hypothetical protein
VAVAVVDDGLEEAESTLGAEIVLFRQDPDELVTGGLDGESILPRLVRQRVHGPPGADAFQRQAVGGTEQHLPLRLGKLGELAH